MSREKMKESAPNSPPNSERKQTSLFAFMKRASNPTPKAGSAKGTKDANKPISETYSSTNSETNADDHDKVAKDVSTGSQGESSVSNRSMSVATAATEAASISSQMDEDDSDDDGPVVTSRRKSSKQGSNVQKAKQMPASRKAKAPSRSRVRRSNVVDDSDSDEEFIVSDDGDDDFSVSSDSDVTDLSQVDDDGEDMEDVEEVRPSKRRGKQASTQSTKRARIQRPTPTTSSSTRVATPVTSNPPAHSSIVPNVEVVAAPKQEDALPPPLVTALRLPTGDSNVLEGETVVVTGILETLLRDTVKPFIESHGGRCTSAVSGKTTILLHGLMLENGKEYTEGSKYRAAMAQNAKVDPNGKGRARTTPIKIMSEEQFLQYLDERLPPSQRRPPPPAIDDIAVPSSDIDLHASEPTSSTSIAAASSSSSAATSDAAAVSSRKVPVSTTDMLWTDKYRPRRLEEVVGNHPQLQALDTWLRNWESRHGQGSSSAGGSASSGGSAYYGRGSRSGGTGSRAALISGPPGIGKTSTATLIAERYGYSVMELNASDVRAMRALREILPSATTTTVASFDALRTIHQNALEGRSLTSGRGLKRLLIMDEVDGMSSGDRGGNAEFIKHIRSSKIPIIAICNDRQNPRMQTLANHCLDLKFTRPATEAIVNRMMQICKVEGVNAEKQALAMIVESCGGDIRQVLNTLQMWKAGPQARDNAAQSKDITLANVRDRMESINKDSILRLDGYSATSRLFTSTIGPQRASLEDRLNYFFVDYDIVPLLVQQCIPDAITKPPAPEDPVSAIERLSSALDSASDADIFAEAVRSRQSWALLPSMGMSLVKATTVAQTPNPSSPFFPMWFSKTSSRNKRARLLASLCLHASGKFSGSRTALRMDYFDPLRAHLLAPMVEASQGTRDVKDAVSTSIDRLVEYGLSNTDLMESMMEITFPPSVGKPTKAGQNMVIPDYSRVLESRVKGAFTREYNKRGNPSQSLASVSAGLVSSMAGVTRRTSTASLLDDEEEEVFSDDDNVKKEEDDLSEFKVKPKRKAPAKKRATKKSAKS